jgi:hypothetical protein
MPQGLENSEAFLANLACRRLDSGPFPDFPMRRREIFGSESRSDMNGLVGSVAKYEHSLNFLLADVTRITYESSTLHRCAEINPREPSSPAGIP